MNAARTPLIAANWKMNKTIGEALSYIKELKGFVKDIREREIAVCAPFTALSALSAVLKGSNIGLGAQNMHFENEGAFTGEVSAKMLWEIGAKYVILGHSERRQLFGERDEMINKKVKKALESELNVIFCTGESLEQREANSTEAVLERQLRKGLAGITDMRGIVIAYEPLWAIGTGKTATPEQAQEAHEYARELLASMLGEDAAEHTRIIYGGSMKPENAKALMAKPDIDGGLVGVASLDAKSFAEIVKY